MDGAGRTCITCNLIFPIMPAIMIQIVLHLHVTACTCCRQKHACWNDHLCSVLSPHKTRIHLYVHAHIQTKTSQYALYWPDKTQHTCRWNASMNPGRCLIIILRLEASEGLSAYLAQSWSLILLLCSTISTIKDWSSVGSAHTCNEPDNEPNYDILYRLVETHLQIHTHRVSVQQRVGETKYKSADDHIHNFWFTRTHSFDQSWPDT